jgi:malonate decarboxylase alpha subunit
VETLDAVEIGKKAGIPITPIMIYGNDVSHVVSEEGIAYLYKTEGIEERRRALAAGGGQSHWAQSEATRDGGTAAPGRGRVP